MSPATLLICTRCRAPGDDPTAPRAGAALLAAVRAAADGPSVRIVGAACLSGCKRQCVAALTAPGKVTYLFGDLPADANGAADLLSVARSYLAREDGYLRRKERPERLQAGILARLPPMAWIPQDSQSEILWPA